MNPFRNLSTQFHVTHEKLGHRDHSLTLSSFDSPMLARVTFDHWHDEDNYGKSTIDIDYLKSHEEGKGYARALMEHLYKRYPKSFISWGPTIHPAATHLAEEMAQKYGRTDWEQDDGEEDY
jgi:GNAT superfamily N-acetyltransferase